jgi:hypothetical protein
LFAGTACFAGAAGVGVLLRAARKRFRAVPLWLAEMLGRLAGALLRRFARTVRRRCP